MASTTGGEPRSPAKAMDAKLMMATGHGDVQQLKDLVTKQDATTMVVVMSSGEQAAAVAECHAPAAAMSPLLQASTCWGSLNALHFLFDREDAQEPPMRVPSQEFLDLLTGMSGSREMTSLPTMHQASRDVEQGASVLLQGVTVEGHTALHLVASHGDGDNFSECAELIYHRGRAQHLDLVRQNEKGDTPLHCAARAGHSSMVSLLISLAKEEDSSEYRLKELVRKENKSKETALHDAVRLGNHQMVRDLMAADPELATFPIEGASPLYLAILQEKGSIARMLHQKSNGRLSYSGANGQNALHAAVLRSRVRGQGIPYPTSVWKREKTVITKDLLGWNKDLTAQPDENGSTPLHFAAAQRPPTSCTVCWVGFGIPNVTWVCRQVFKANPAALYQPDKDGLFPIHVAASLGSSENVNLFLQMSPGSAGLRDAMGRTFLHVAVEERQFVIVSRACRNRSLTWILNMQDNHGDTALHLAVQTGRLQIFCALLRNPHVQLNLANHKRQTPLDVSRYNRPPGFFYAGNTEARIQESLQLAGANRGGYRTDHFIKNYKIMHQQKLDDESKELEKLRDSTQSLCIGAVLIATVTFGATFALPGGYKADDHPNGGTPTLAGRYAFDAFMMANTLAFVCSSIATVGFMFSGSPMVNLRIRKLYTNIALYFMQNSVVCLSATFALGAYMVLAPVAHKTAVAICVIGPLVVLFSKAEYWIKLALVTPSLCVRRGMIWTLRRWTWLLVFNMVFQFWSLIFIFGWAAHARN